MAILIDTSVLVAAAFAKDTNHAQANHLLKRFPREERIVPLPVLVEQFHVITVRTNYERAVQVFGATITTFLLERLYPVDLSRMRQIMEDYHDARFDFVDVAIMAISELLNIRQVATFDRRDFPIFRPVHCDNLELLP